MATTAKLFERSKNAQTDGSLHLFPTELTYEAYPEGGSNTNQVLTTKVNKGTLMAKTSLTDFVVSMNRQFWRSKFPFEKSLRPRFHDAAGCYLSYFKTVLGSKGISSWMFGVRDALWAILVHEPVRLTNRSPGNPELVGGQLINHQPGRHYDQKSISQG